MSFEEFKRRFQADSTFHGQVRKVIEEWGGMNLWDSQDMETFFEVYSACLED